MYKGDFDESLKSILSGKLLGSELIIGLVGAVGANLNIIVQDLGTCLDKYNYSTKEIHVSELIENITTVSEFDDKNQYARIDTLMTAGDNARNDSKENSILALAVVSQICGTRKTNDGSTQPMPNNAFIVNSLKHPAEVKALRQIYGNSFILIGVYVECEKRKKYLTRSKGMRDHEAELLMKRDEAEGTEYGQRTRDTFHLSDFFVHLVDDDDEKLKTQNTLDRFLKIIFAHPYKTPLFDEYAMYMAFAAAARSADLSRQIGAVIAKDDDIIATGANECPRAGGGTYWPHLDDMHNVVDDEKGRDYTRKEDTNHINRNLIVEDAIEKMKDALNGKLKSNICDQDWDMLKIGLHNSTIKDITEYGRVVHAEMVALLTCARRGISCKDATLYTTTFPCHNCAKHIIAAGIKRVVYVEPYPKSKALDFHEDSVMEGFEYLRPANEKRVIFEPFVGVGARRFIDLFSINQGTGFPVKRKDNVTGMVLTWDEKSVIMRTPEFPWSYLQREEIASHILKKYLKGENSGEQTKRRSKKNKAN